MFLECSTMNFSIAGKDQKIFFNSEISMKDYLGCRIAA